MDNPNHSIAIVLLYSQWRKKARNTIFRHLALQIAMKIVGHTDYQTTANIYTHVRDEMLKKATVNMNEVFQKRTEE